MQTWQQNRARRRDKRRLDLFRYAENEWRAEIERLRKENDYLRDRLLRITPRVVK